MHRFSLLFILALLTSFYRVDSEQALIKDDFSFATKQLKNMLKELPDTSMAFPRTTDTKGKLVTTNMYDWTPGFFPGSLWYTYEYTGDNNLKKAAVEWTEKLEPLKDFTAHHDLGFMMYCSYGNAYRLTGNENYKAILVQAAKSLSTRFSPVTGTIRSWNRFASWHGNHTYNYPVIIDNMMNLELLFFASKVTGDTSFKHVAVTHALNTLQNQVRPDFTCYHVVCYDSATGKVLARETGQGYADNSTWSRGQAWGIYGFTVAYRETKDIRFLETAKKMADVYLGNKNLPKDKVPYWDFDAHKPGYKPGINSYALKVQDIPRDASAAAITASALLELSTYCDSLLAKKYVASSAKMLASLSSPAYRAKVGTNGNFLLKHSVGSIPHKSEIDVPLVYADYYFLEALGRYNRLLNHEDVLSIQPASK